MARTYEIQKISIDEVINDGQKEQIRKSIVINRIQTICIAFFGISFAIVAGASVFFKARDTKFIETGAGKICGLILALSIIAYIIVHFLAGAIPKKNWKCPHCNESLSYFVPSGTKASAGNRRAQIISERKGLRIGRVDKSFLMVPEKCPYCDQKLLTDKE